MNPQLVQAYNPQTYQMRVISPQIRVISPQPVQQIQIPSHVHPSRRAHVFGQSATTLQYRPPTYQQPTQQLRSIASVQNPLLALYPPASSRQQQYMTRAVHSQPKQQNPAPKKDVSPPKKKKSTPSSKKKKTKKKKLMPPPPKIKMPPPPTNKVGLKKTKKKSTTKKSKKKKDNASKKKNNSSNKKNNSSNKKSNASKEKNNSSKRKKKTKVSSKKKDNAPVAKKEIVSLIDSDDLKSRSRSRENKKSQSVEKDKRSESQTKETDEQKDVNKASKSAEKEAEVVGQKRFREEESPKKFPKPKRTRFSNSIVKNSTEGATEFAGVPAEVNPSYAGLKTLPQKRSLENPEPRKQKKQAVEKQKNKSKPAIIEETPVEDSTKPTGQSSESKNIVDDTHKEKVLPKKRKRSNSEDLPAKKKHHSEKEKTKSKATKEEQTNVQNIKMEKDQEEEKDVCELKISDTEYRCFQFDNSLYNIQQKYGDIVMKIEPKEESQGRWIVKLIGKSGPQVRDEIKKRCVEISSKIRNITIDIDPVVKIFLKKEDSPRLSMLRELFSCGITMSNINDKAYISGYSGVVQDVRRFVQKLTIMLKNSPLVFEHNMMVPKQCFDHLNAGVLFELQDDHKCKIDILPASKTSMMKTVRIQGEWFDTRIVESKLKEIFFQSPPGDVVFHQPPSDWKDILDEDDNELTQPASRHSKMEVSQSNAMQTASRYSKHGRLSAYYKDRIGIEKFDPFLYQEDSPALQKLIAIESDETYVQEVGTLISEIIKLEDEAYREKDTEILESKWKKIEQMSMTLIQLDIETAIHVSRKNDFLFLKRLIDIYTSDAPPPKESFEIVEVELKNTRGIYVNNKHEKNIVILDMDSDNKFLAKDDEPVETSWIAVGKQPLKSELFRHCFAKGRIWGDVQFAIPEFKTIQFEKNEPENPWGLHFRFGHKRSHFWVCKVEANSQGEKLGVKFGDSLKFIDGVRVGEEDNLPRIYLTLEREGNPCEMKFQLFKSITPVLNTSESDFFKWDPRKASFDYSQSDYKNCVWKNRNRCVKCNNLHARQGKKSGCKKTKIILCPDTGKVPLKDICIRWNTHFDCEGLCKKAHVCIRCRFPESGRERYPGDPAFHIYHTCTYHQEPMSYQEEMEWQIKVQDGEMGHKKCVMCPTHYNAFQIRCPAPNCKQLASDFSKQREIVGMFTTNIECIHCGSKLFPGSKHCSYCRRSIPIQPGGKSWSTWDCDKCGRQRYFAVRTHCTHCKKANPNILTHETWTQGIFQEKALRQQMERMKIENASKISENDYRIPLLTYDGEVSKLTKIRLERERKDAEKKKEKEKQEKKKQKADVIDLISDSEDENDGKEALNNSKQTESDDRGPQDMEIEAPVREAEKEKEWELTEADMDSDTEFDHETADAEVDEQNVESSDDKNVEANEKEDDQNIEMDERNISKSLSTSEGDEGKNATESDHQNVEKNADENIENSEDKNIEVNEKDNDQNIEMDEGNISKSLDEQKNDTEFDHQNVEANVNESISNDDDKNIETNEKSDNQNIEMDEGNINKNLNSTEEKNVSDVSMDDKNKNLASKENHQFESNEENEEKDDEFSVEAVESKSKDKNLDSGNKDKEINLNSVVEQNLSSHAEDKPRDLDKNISEIGLAGEIFSPNVGVSNNENLEREENTTASKLQNEDVHQITSLNENHENENDGKDGTEGNSMCEIEQNENNTLAENIVKEKMDIDVKNDNGTRKERINIDEENKGINIDEENKRINIDKENKKIDIDEENKNVTLDEANKNEKIDIDKANEIEIIDIVGANKITKIDIDEKSKPEKMEIDEKNETEKMDIDEENSNENTTMDNIQMAMIEKDPDTEVEVEDSIQKDTNTNQNKIRSDVINLEKIREKEIKPVGSEIDDKSDKSLSIELNESVAKQNKNIVVNEVDHNNVRIHQNLQADQSDIEIKKNTSNAMISDELKDLGNFFSDKINLDDDTKNLQHHDANLVEQEIQNTTDVNDSWEVIREEPTSKPNNVMIESTEQTNTIDLNKPERIKINDEDMFTSEISSRDESKQGERNFSSDSESEESENGENLETENLERQISVDMDLDSSSENEDVEGSDRHSTGSADMDMGSSDSE